jgi:hypothetical protein
MRSSAASADPLRLKSKLLTPNYLFAAAVVLSIPFLLYVHRDIGPYADEWGFLTGRSGFGAFQLFTHLNGQLMFVTSVGFTLVEKLFSPGAIWPLAVISVAAQVVVAWLAYIYMGRRAGQWFALFAAVLILLLGSGWEVIVWSFNFGWIIATAAGLGALVVFEGSESRRATIGASLLLILGLASGGMAAPFVVAIALYAIWPETRRRALIVIAAPVVIYGLWMVTYGSDFHHQRHILDAMGSAYVVASNGFGAIFGAGDEIGAALLVAAVIGLFVRFERAGSIDRQTVVVLSIPLSLWAIIAVERTGISDLQGSRYMYSSAIFLLLAASHFVRLVKPTQAVKIAAVGLFLVALLGNLGLMRAGARGMRGNSSASKTFLTALAMTDAADGAHSKLEPRDPGFFLRNSSRPETYEFAVSRGANLRYAFGAVPTLPPPDRAAVDFALVNLTKAHVSSEPSLPTDDAPVQALDGAPPALPDTHGCLHVPADHPIVEVEMQIRGIVVEGDQAVRLRVKRFGDVYPTQAKTTLPPGIHSFSMSFGASDVPWKVLLQSKSAFTVCGPAK